MTLVSIVTPSYNQAPFLEQTMQSVLEQDYPRIEYIVVDGGSTDSSVEVIKKYADRLAYWISEKDSGQGEAINKGFARANGEILAWLNSDDYYMRNTVSAAVRCFEQNPDVVMVYGDMLAVNGDGQTINVLKYKQLSLEDLLCFQIIGQPSVFFRRSALEKIGRLDPTFHFMLDHHLWIRLAQLGRILHVSQVWSAARYHPQAKNRARAAEFGREAFRVLDWAKKQPELAESVSKVKRRALASAHRYDSRYLLDGGQAASALGAWFRALFIHPPTALARLNIFVSALLTLTGLSRLRKAVLRRRQRKLSGNK
ncbi:MAG TPA: glycosyltransferase family 2 protein [Anaerolineales bacterium]|nr:glycosyltransferase family 2 protein [Anaerolineales bacterium]